MDEVEERVLKAVRKIVKKDEIRVQDSFEDLGVDSLDAIEILFEVEEEFGIDIPSDSAKTVRSVHDVAEGVRKILAGEAPETPPAAGEASPS